MEVKANNLLEKKDFESDNPGELTGRASNEPAESTVVSISPQPCLAPMLGSDDPPDLESDSDDLEVTGLIPAMSSMVLDLPSSPEKSLADELEEEGLVQESSNPCVSVVGGTKGQSPGIGSEDYVDEKQLEEYLRQLQMEKCEEKLIEENLPNTPPVSPGAHITPPAGGARPKQRAHSPPSEMTDLEPTISVGQKLPEPAEFEISEEDLNPMIGAPDSPPPYSEVDPMVDGQRLQRPLTLRLEDTPPPEGKQ